MITLEIYGTPISQQRPRFSKKTGRCFDSQAAIKEGVKWQIKSQYREKPLSIPLFMNAIFFMPIAKSHSALKKKQMANGLLGHIQRPDLDNLVKFILDCLNNLVIEDDSLICEMKAKKVYSTQPSTIVRLIPLAKDKVGLLDENILREIV